MLTSQAPSLVTDDVLASLRSAAQRLKGNEKPFEELFDAKILIVDDEPINVRLVRKFLSAQGYRNFVTTTESFQSIQLIEREQPDRLVLDVMMPGDTWSGSENLPVSSPGGWDSMTAGASCSSWPRNCMTSESLGFPTRFC